MADNLRKLSTAEDVSMRVRLGSSKCRKCGLAVYAAESVRHDGRTFHRNCFRCTRCNKSLNTVSYETAVDKQLYCTPCFGMVEGGAGGGLRYDRKALYDKHRKSKIYAGFPAMQVVSDAVRHGHHPSAGCCCGCGLGPAATRDCCFFFGGGWRAPAPALCCGVGLAVFGWLPGARRPAAAPRSTWADTMDMAGRAVGRGAALAGRVSEQERRVGVSQPQPVAPRLS